MPLINVKLIDGVFTQAQKQEMIRKLTDAMVSIEGDNLREVTWVIVEEVASGDWGMGGRCVSRRTDDEAVGVRIVTNVGCRHTRADERRNAYGRRRCVHVIRLRLAAGRRASHDYAIG